LGIGFHQINQNTKVASLVLASGGRRILANCPAIGEDKDIAMEIIGRSITANEISTSTSNNMILGTCLPIHCLGPFTGAQVLVLEYQNSQ
jgi:hypothetical protein